jgi:hypothetical protein
VFSVRCVLSLRLCVPIPLVCFHLACLFSFRLGGFITPECSVFSLCGFIAPRVFCVFITVACFIPLVCSCVLTSQCFAMRAPHRITNPRRLHAGYGSASLILGALRHTTKQRITNPRATSRYRRQKMKEPSRNLYSTRHYLDTSATKELGETLLPVGHPRCRS